MTAFAMHFNIARPIWIKRWASVQVNPVEGFMWVGLFQNRSHYPRVNPCPPSDLALNLKQTCSS